MNSGLGTESRQALAAYREELHVFEPMDDTDDPQAWETLPDDPQDDESFMTAIHDTIGKPYVRHPCRLARD